jgi:hypothetical protein
LTIEKNAEADTFEEIDMLDVPGVIESVVNQALYIKEWYYLLLSSVYYEHSVLHACGAVHAGDSEKTKTFKIVEALGLLPCSIITANGVEENTLAQKM